jgi:hypothetical protein
LNFGIPQGETGQDGADGVGVPSGGTTGQVLKKKSGTDYDTEWANESGGGSGGHTIINSAGTDMTQRDGLQFSGLNVTDDSANDKTVVTLPTPDYVDAQYNPSTSWKKGMTCISGNKRYRCKVNNTGSQYAPPNATYWEVLSVTSQLNEPLTSLEKMLTQSTNELVAIDSVHGLEYKTVTIANTTAGVYNNVALGSAGYVAIMPWTYAEVYGAGGTLLNGIVDYPLMLDNDWITYERDDASGTATGKAYQYYIKIKQNIGNNNNIVLHLWTIRRTDA